MAKSGHSFQKELSRKFVYKGDLIVKLVSKTMGISSSTLYKWIEGERDVSVDYLLPYLKATKDYRYLKYLARECGFQLVPKVNKKMVAQLISELARVLASLVDSNGDEEEE
ncbi:MAG: hypothetical protein KAT69_09555 [Candidatus Aminicenantes bacterium]|nr:hypothetical protein [Candidatus Aminicenantes bacterium]